MEQKKYDALVQQISPKTPVLVNCLKAFIVGGGICVIGQAIMFLLMMNFNFTEKTVGNPTVAIIIFITMFLTGFGVYRKIGQFAGAGSAVPVTGFGNAVISAAIEARSEGFVLGVGSNMFKLAGSVILFGIVSAFIVAIVKMLFVTLGIVSW